MPDELRSASRYLLGALFVAAGANHFVHTPFYVSIMPPYLPWPLALVYVSGSAEMILGGLLMFPRWAAWAAWGLIALSIAVFPANLHMALHPEQFDYSPAMLWLRLPLQFVIIAWAWCYTRARSSATWG